MTFKKGNTIPVTHGHSRFKKETKEYRIWQGMRTRCLNPKFPAYKNYGGRGIDVCERWNDFINFYSDMGPIPSPKHTLDRIDNNKGYHPENCRWATRAEQARNNRRTRLIEHNGKTLCLKDWAKEYGLKYMTLFMRMKRKSCSMEEALKMGTV